MRIPLTQGKYALIDDADHDLIKDYKWYAYYNYDNWYAYTNIRTHGRRHTIGMHRLILNAQTGQQVDHINHDGLDNRRTNIRLCTRLGNARNRRSMRGGSVYKGVSWHAGGRKWRAQIVLNGRPKCLGLFAEEQDAARAYDKAAERYFGVFACLNQI